MCQTLLPKHTQNQTIITSVPNFTAKRHLHHQHQCAKTQTKHCQQCAKLYCLNIFNTSSPACQTQLPIYIQNIATRMPNITANAKVKYIQVVITSVPNCAATSSFKWKHIQTYKYIKHCHRQCAKLSRHFFFQVTTHSKHQNTFDIMHSNYGIISSKQFSNKIHFFKHHQIYTLYE